MENFVKEEVLIIDEEQSYATWVKGAEDRDFEDFYNCDGDGGEGEEFYDCEGETYKIEGVESMSQEVGVEEG